MKLGLILSLISLTAWATPEPGNVILIHPDGTSLNAWNAFRIATVGPDGMTEWDQLPEVALYRSHFADGLSPSSHGGATAHAWGIKPVADSFGTDGGRPINARSGKAMPLLAEALSEDLAVGIVQSGQIAEPGTAVFLTAHPTRRDYAGIAAKLITSGAQVMLSGGEIHLLPRGQIGFHGKEGTRNDRRNLIEEARRSGYTVVFTRDELKKAAGTADKLLGVFAAEATYHARPEEELAEAGLPLYEPGAPTVAEMTEAAIEVLVRSGKRFALVVEEEGTDDFANRGNPSGVFEAFRRADAAIGVAREFLNREPATLLLTAADSDASGMQIVGLGRQTEPDEEAPMVPAATTLGNPVDGINGTGTAAFLSGPDREGRRFWFGITFSSGGDLVGGVVARAAGRNSERLPLHLDNTGIYEVLYETLFGRTLPPR